MWEYLRSVGNDLKGPETIMISKDEKYLYNSEKIAIKPHQKYKLTVKLRSKKGKPHSAYLAVMILGLTNMELIRHIRWINDFSGQLKDYTIAFTTTAEAANAVLGYRINVETPAKCDMEINLPAHSLLRLEETSNEVEDSFDDINDFRVPALQPLNEEEENLLEKKIVWIFGAPRSGTTWLGERLLRHPQNIVWPEPYIGNHLDKVRLPQSAKESYLTWSQYFFSPHHKYNWLPALRKLILARAYSYAQTLTKNVIIKEPNGSGGADLVLESLSDSKLIFLLRDGRDVVDSSFDAHRQDSWNRDQSRKLLLTREIRFEAIHLYSQRWKMITETVLKAYQKHNPDLRLLVRYEDLRMDTFAELRKIYNFLHISISDDELKKIVDRYDFKNIPESEKGPGKFNRSATPGGWKKNFSKEEQELMNSIMGGTLTQMGYEISVGNIQNNLDDEGHGIARNYQTWQNWNWERGGEEWTVSPEWKRSLIKEIMLKYIEPEKSVLEIGPGAGRWTESLQKIAMSLILVDLSDKCIDFCKQRFHHCDNIQYFVNNGASLDFIQDETVDFIWSFDVFVHINPSDTEKYIKEFSRILVSGGRGIIHHPAEGGQHGGARSKITAELFSDMLKRYGLALVAQFDSWGEKGEFDVRFHHDTVTVFEKAKLRKSASSVDTKKQISFLRISDETSRVAISKEYANALKRWQACKPNEGLTWGVKITGDAFIGLAQKRNIFSPYRSVLELGPGYGRLLSSILSMNIPFKSYTGIDISENNIQYLQGNFKQNNIDFVQGNFNAVKLNGKYDIVLSSLTLKHQYPSFLDALRNIDQYVSNDGVYFFDLLENRNMYDGNEDLTKSPSKIAWEKDGVYIALYTQKEVLRILDSISLQIIAFDHVTHVKERGDRLVVIAGRKYSIKK